MYSTLLWYLDDGGKNSEKSYDKITAEYVKQDGKLYTDRNKQCDMRRYCDDRFIPGRNAERD